MNRKNLSLLTWLPFNTGTARFPRFPYKTLCPNKPLEGAERAQISSYDKPRAATQITLIYSALFHRLNKTVNEA
jgi:hypothetical protein